MGKHNDISGLSNNTQIGDRQEVVEAFNICFSKIGLQTGLNVPKVNKSFKSFMPKPTLHSIFLAPVSQSNVLNITLKLKPKTSSGYDGISTKLLKATINEILEPLTHVINTSFETGRVSNDMKIEKVIPIFKFADKILLKNCRPLAYSQYLVK